MAATRTLDWIISHIKDLTAGNAIAEVYLILWAFEYLLEGTAGFGTPVALAAPIMVEIGHDPVLTVASGLVLNGLATNMGAVGTGTLFGFSPLGLTEEQLLSVGNRTQLLNTLMSPLVVFAGAWLLIPANDLARNWRFCLLATYACTIPAFLSSFISVAFPSLIGGVVGLGLVAILAKYKVGLDPNLRPRGRKSVDGTNTIGPLTSASGSQRRLPRTSLRGLLSGSVSHVNDHTGDYEALNAEDLDDDDMEANHTQRSHMPEDLGEVEESTEHRWSGGRENTTSQRGSVESPSRSNPESPLRAGTPVQTMNGAALQMQTLENSEMGDHTGPGDINIELHGHRMRHFDSGLVDGFMRSFPLWGTVLVLMFTRIPIFGLKSIVTATEPHLAIPIPYVFKIVISAGLVVGLEDIFGQADLEWDYRTLYVPALLPFQLIAAITLAIWMPPRVPNFGREFLRLYGKIHKKVAARLPKTAVVLGFAVILVHLMILADFRDPEDASQDADDPKFEGPAAIVGHNLAVALGGGWIAVSALIGGIGCFFSDVTVSNLTFGEVQLSAADALGFSSESMLAFQGTGAAIGNMTCLVKIINAAAMVDLSSVRSAEAAVLKRTIPLFLVLVLIATALGALIFSIVY
eukprot:Clim_evm6s248 gene=Clim_evmTU6s248